MLPTLCKFYLKDITATRIILVLLLIDDAIL
jgi:hypothetical protein